jgi:hypothetical protein
MGKMLSRPMPGSNTVLTNRFFQVCFEPDDEGAGGQEPSFDFAAPTEALSLDRGAQILGDSLADDVPKGREREPTTGRFKGGEKPAEDENKVVDLKTGKPPEKAEGQEQTKAEAEDEDPEFEFEPEAEGKEPVRRRLSELVTAFEKAQTLEKEVEDLRGKASQVPTEYAEGLRQIVEDRGRYLQSLEYVSKLFNPVEPDPNLANPNHPNYDPQAYWAAKEAYDRSKTAVEQIRKEYEAEKAKQDEQTKLLLNAYMAREREALYKAWPEAKSPEVAKQVAETLKRDYGFTDQEIAATSDHRMFLVVRDAMAFRASKAKEAEAVKVVRKLPKLVKGAARSTTDSKAAGRSQAMARLAETGSIHDAVKAIEGLI